MKLFRVVRSTLFLGILCVSLLVTVAGLAVHASSLAGKLALATATMAQMALDHKKAMSAAASAHRADRAKAVSRTKAKARIRRWAIAGSAIVPVAGVFAAPTVAGYFEVADFNDWKTDNPEGEFGEYACEAGDLSAELIDESLQELPDTIRPDADRVRSWMPECGVSMEEQPWKVVKAPPSIWSKFDGLIPSSDDVRNWISSMDIRELTPDAMRDWIPKVFGKE